MFPKITIHTSNGKIYEKDIIKEINLNYSKYSSFVNEKINKICSYKYNFLNEFKYKSIKIWYANNLFERNIQKGNLINNFLILAYFEFQKSKNIKILRIDTNSPYLYRTLNKLNLNTKINFKYLIINFLKNKTHFLRSLKLFLLVIINIVFSKQSIDLLTKLKNVENILLIPNDSNNYESLSEDKIIFQNKFSEITKQKILHLSYITKYQLNLKNLFFHFFNKKLTNNNSVIGLLNFSEVIKAYFIFIKFYFFSKKYYSEIESKLKIHKEEYLFHLIEEDLYAIFFGSLLFQNLLTITYLSKIKNIIYQCNSIFYLFENQYWEKLLLQIFKSKNINKIGLHDGPPKLWDSSLFLQYDKINHNLLPDYIFYTSPIYPKLVSINKNLFDKLIPIESFKYNFKKIKNSYQKNSILIYGDGNLISNDLILDLFLKIRKKLSYFKFYYKPHPDLKLLRIPNNLEIVDNHLKVEYFITSNSSNSYLDLLLINRIPFVFCSEFNINKSIFSYLNLHKYLFTSKEAFLNLMKQQLLVRDENNNFKIIKKIILIDDTYTNFHNIIKKIF